MLYLQAEFSKAHYKAIGVNCGQTVPFAHSTAGNNVLHSIQQGNHNTSTIVAMSFPHCSFSCFIFVRGEENTKDLEIRVFLVISAGGEQGGE